MNQDDIENLLILRNNSPIDDFEGLSANQAHYLLHYPFSERSPLQFQKQISDEVLDKVPFLRLTEVLLNIIT